MLREAGAARWFIAGVVALAIAGSIGTLAFAFELSAFIARASYANLWLGLLGAAIKAGTVFAQEPMATLAAARVKAQLRSKLLDKVFNAGSTWQEHQKSTELSALLTSGLDALDAYFAKFLPQIVYTVLAMPMFLVVIFNQDALSGVIIILTMPLIPLFMVIIGMATARVQERQLGAMLQLSNYFGEIIRGILTLKVFNRVVAQEQNLVELSRRHRKQTMKVLSVSFLSGFALELIASLSVALIAVSIGLRLVSGTIDYRVGLFVLLIAPDAFLPVRMIGANFHASTEGVSAINRTFALLDSKFVQPVARRIEVAAGQFTVLVGESGTGKSTALEALVGQQAAWLPQSTVLLPGTVEQNITGFEIPDHHSLSRSVQLAMLDDVSLELEASELNAAVSGGQLQRIGLARALYRFFTKDCTLLLLDEPLSAQDPDRAKSIARNLKHLVRDGISIVAVSHQDALTRVADRKIEFKS